MRKFTTAMALAAFAEIACVHAQTYPSRQITLIVPFPPGGPTDVAARILAERMRTPLGQPVQGAVALPQIRGGKIKALANLSPQRSASMPDIPTADETGVKGLYMSGWFGFWGPKGTPKDIIAKLNAAMVEALADPAVKARFTELGLDVAAREQQTPEGLAAFQKAEIDKWWPIIKKAGNSAQP